MARRSVRRWLVAVALLAALLAALLGAGQVQAASAWKSSRARYDGLVLTLRTRVMGATAVARATLKNEGSRSWQYARGCVPPEVQIRATDSAGRLVYGWTLPRPRCLIATTIVSLAPGAHLTVHARFPISATTAVWAAVPASVTNEVLFRTPPIRVAPSLQD